MNLGTLPADWERSTLAAVAARQPNAIVDGPFGSSLKLSDYVETGVPVLQGKNITNDRFRWLDVRFISEAKANELRRSATRVGDVLMVKIGSIGYSAVVESLHGFELAIIPANLAKMTPDPARVDTDYLHHWMRTATVKTYLQSSASKTAQPALSLGKIRELPLPLPPLPEQRRIAAILDQADTLRAKRREALAQLDSLTQSIFMEMFGDYRDDEVRWPARPMEEIAAETAIGLVRSAEQFGLDYAVPYVRMNAVGPHGEFLPNLVLRTDVTEDEFRRYQLRPGDFLFNTRNSRELVGKTALFRELGPYVFNNNLMRIRFIDGVQPEYVAAAFQTPYIQRELEIRKAGTTSVFAIYARELKTVPVPVPPWPLQQTFATRIQSVESLKATHRAALAELDALFASLQHRAFTGQLS